MIKCFPVYSNVVQPLPYLAPEPVPCSPPRRKPFGLPRALPGLLLLGRPPGARGGLGFSHASCEGSIMLTVISVFLGRKTLLRVEFMLCVFHHNGEKKNHTCLQDKLAAGVLWTK